MAGLNISATVRAPTLRRLSRGINLGKAQGEYELSPGSIPVIQNRLEIERDKVARSIVYLAKRIAPVRTGKLRRSVQRVNRFTVYPTQFYGGYVEFGTVFQAPKYYVRRTVERLRIGLRRNIAIPVDLVIKRNGRVVGRVKHSLKIPLNRVIEIEYQQSTRHFSAARGKRSNIFTPVVFIRQRSFTVFNLRIAPLRR